MRGLLATAEWLALAMAYLAGLVLAGLVVMTFIDVILRYVFLAPLLGRQDIQEVAMVAVVFLAAPHTWMIGGHIVVDLLPDYRWRILTLARDLAVRLIGIALFALLANQAAVRAEEAVLFGAGTNMISLPHAPFFWLMAAALWIQVAALVVESLLLVAGQPLHTGRLGEDETAEIGE